MFSLSFGLTRDAKRCEWEPGRLEIVAVHTSVSGVTPREEYYQKNWVGMCGPLPKTLTLFVTKIFDFTYPTYDLTKNLIPYL